MKTFSRATEFACTTTALEIRQRDVTPKNGETHTGLMEDFSRNISTKFC